MEEITSFFSRYSGWILSILLCVLSIVLMRISMNKALKKLKDQGRLHEMEKGIENEKIKRSSKEFRIIIMIIALISFFLMMFVLYKTSVN